MAQQVTSKLLWLPLLAATLPADADLDALPYPLWGSPKIDGYRVIGQNDKAVSRKGIEYRNTALRAMFASRRGQLEGLDGEVCIGPPWAPDVFNRTQNCVNNGSVEAAEEFRRHGTFHVFGLYDLGGGHAYQGIEQMFECLKRNYARQDKIRIVPQKLIRNTSQLLSFEATQLEKGYEGVMLRRSDGPCYPQKLGKENRSTMREFYLVKLKRMEFGEVVIKAAHWLEHNKNEDRTATGARRSVKAGKVTSATQVGRVDVLEITTKAKFSLTVSTNELRNKGMPWWMKQIGKRVRYKYQLTGTLNAPRICTATFEELL
jgi:DNA ligase-1